MKKEKDWWAIPAIIVFIFVNAYGLILINAPILKLQTGLLEESKISQVVVTNNLKVQESFFRESWIKKNGPSSVKSKQYQNWLSHNLKVTETNLKKSVSKATFGKSGTIFDEEFEVVQKKAIFSSFGENIKHGFWYLFFKGLILSFFSFVFIIFLNRQKIDLEKSDYSDVEKMLFKVPAISLILAFVVNSILFYRLAFVDVDSVVISIVLACIFFLEYFVFYFVIHISVYTVDYLIILFNWMAKMFDRVAYYWLRNRFDGDILGAKTLESLAQKNNFFVFHQEGIQKVVCQQDEENNIPTFHWFEGKNVSSVDFFSAFIEGSVGDYLRRLNTKATRNFRNHFSFNGKKEVLNYAKGIADRIQSKVNLEVSEMSLKDGKSDYVQTEKILGKILSKSLKLFRQKLISESKDEVYKMTAGLRKLLYNEIRREEMFDQNNGDFYRKAILPLNTRFFLSKQNLDIFVIEQAPQRRTISYLEDKYFLSFPYVVFIVSFKDGVFQRLNVFYSEKPLKSLDDMAYHSSFNNVNDDGSVCVGVSDELQVLKGTLGKKVDEVISTFWQTNFNDDITDCFDQYEDDLIDYDTWARKSKEQPDFFSTISLVENESLTKVIDSIIEDELGDVDEFSCAKKLRSTIDSWFEANASNINESVLRVWSDICLNEFSTKEVESFMISRNKEIDNLLGLIRRICLECADDEVTKKVFLTELIKSFEETVRKDFKPLLSSVPFKVSVSFSKLFNDKNRV